MTRWYLQPILGSYGLVVLLAVVLLGLLLLGPRQTLSPRRRRILIALRLAVIFLLCLAMLRPSMVSTLHEPESARLIVLMDVSRSMLIQDAGNGRSRWQAQREALQRAEAEFAAMAGDVELQVLRVRCGAHRVAIRGWKNPIPRPT